MHTGVVAQLDVDGGSVCLAEANDNDMECYPAPGRGLHEGDQVRFALQEVAVDPDDPSKGSQQVLVYILVPEVE